MQWNKIKQRIIEKYQEKNEAKIDDLIWLDRKLDSKNILDWKHVDTVDFDIESILKKKELILDLKLKPKEIEKWQSLNSEK